MNGQHGPLPRQEQHGIMDVPGNVKEIGPLPPDELPVGGQHRNIEPFPGKDHPYRLDGFP